MASGGYAGASASPTAHREDKKALRGYIDGCFDIMHSGHFNAVRQAKGLCDYLVVGIHSDEEISENKALPVLMQDERYALLDHIKWIDEILYDVPYSPLLATLEKARADFCVHGDDMPVNAQGFCAYDDMRDAGKLRIIKRTEGVSTTDLIGRLLTLARQQSVPLEFGCASDPSTPASPASGGITVSDALASPAASPSNAAKPPPLHLGRSAVSSSAVAAAALVAKYGMSADDAAQLQAFAASADGATSASQREQPSCEEFRTSAPVQILTSTRRIAEFASSRQPQEGDRIVYVSGSFDMFHVGHAQFLKEARALGTFLLVGIYDDATAAKAKGSHLPVMNLTERVLNVCACKWADEVIIGAPLAVTKDLIKTWNIQVVARGKGHKRTTCCSLEQIDHDTVPTELGMFVEVESKWPELCHETVVQRIMRSREAYVKRNRVRAQRETEYYEGKNASNVPKEV